MSELIVMALLALVWVASAAAQLWLFREGSRKIQKNYRPRAPFVWKVDTLDAIIIAFLLFMGPVGLICGAIVHTIWFWGDDPDRRDDHSVKRPDRQVTTTSASPIYYDPSKWTGRR